MSASVFALVVAVEEYGEPKWHLPGATVDARLVSEQLIRLGVPPEKIRVFLSPTKLAAAYQFPPALQVRAATFEVIKGVVEDELPTRKEDWLFIFWGGHGILDSERSRRVFLGDATAANKQNVDLNNLLEVLRSQSLPSRMLMRQALVVDACGNAYDELNPQSDLPDYRFPKKRGANPGRQITLLLSSAKGQKAGHHSPKDAPQAGAAMVASGIYTAAFLEELQTVVAWPPDFGLIAARLKTVFEQRKLEKKQTPTVAYYDDSTGDLYSLAGRTGEIEQATVDAGSDDGKLTAAIMALGIFSESATRDSLFASLPWQINRAQPPAKTTDGLALAAACCAQPFGLEALIDICEHLGEKKLADFARNLDTARPTHAVHWSECVELRAALLATGALPNDAQATVAYRATPASQSRNQDLRGAPPDWARGRVFLFEVLRLAPVLPVAQSLFAFLDSCRPHGSAAMGAAIDRWRAAVEERLRAEKIVVAPAEVAPRADSAVLQIQFQPLDHDRLRATPWWRWGAQLELTEKLFESEEIGQDDWPAVVTRAFDEALERDSEGYTFRVEVILPLRNFEREIDAYPVSNGRLTSPLGRHYPVVVRPYERLYQRSYREPRNSWLRKCRKWRDSPDTVSVGVVPDGAAYRPEFFDQLVRDEAAAMVAFTLDAPAPPPEAPTLSPREGVIENVIAAGLPVALCWRRQPSADATDFKNWLVAHDLDQWPEQIWHYRRGEHRGIECPAPKWPELTLLWDSPDLLPPDYQHRAQAPTQRV